MMLQYSTKSVSQVNSKSVSDMLREVATVSPLFFKEVSYFLSQTKNISSYILSVVLFSSDGHHFFFRKFYPESCPRRWFSSYFLQRSFNPQPFLIMHSILMQSTDRTLISATHRTTTCLRTKTQPPSQTYSWNW